MRMQSREHRVREPAALYIRAAGGDPDNTLDLQLERLQRYAGANDLDPERVYFETRGSRAQFDRMIAEATGGEAALPPDPGGQLQPVRREPGGVSAMDGAVGKARSPGRVRHGARAANTGVLTFQAETAALRRLKRKDPDTWQPERGGKSAHHGLPDSREPTEAAGAQRSPLRRATCC